jgi:hypothetical protein
MLHVYSIETEMAQCKAVIQEGARKGLQCQFPPGDTSYCGRHLRNKTYDEGISIGKKWCRFFFRGCNNEVTDDLTCIDCKTRICKKTNNCKHNGCKFKTLGEDFCKKHERDKYYNEEKEKGIKFCNVPRGCFNILKDKKSCDTCLEINRKKDMDAYNNRKTLIKAAEAVNSTTRSCVNCEKDFEVFKTRYNKDSVNCKDCSNKQAIQDKKRENRERNHKNERFRNLERAYREYIKSALKRGYGDFELDFEEFKIIVTLPCNYCKSIKEDEANGIDRLNNDIGYTKENCVPACWKCNRMKHFYNPEFFLEKCKIITKEKIPDKNFYSKWALYYTRTNNRNYTTYKREAEEIRNLPFEITQCQWDWLTRSPCYLCGYQDAHGIGIDRVDNTVRKYTIENCRPCCGSCNSMKNDFLLQEFIEQCKTISDANPIIKDYNIISTNPLKEAEAKGQMINPDDRTHWKSRGIFYAILSDTAHAFQESFKEVFSIDEFNELCKSVKESTNEVALSILKNTLNTLKKRKYRLHNRTTP